MKIKDYPLIKCILIKDFDSIPLVPFSQLTSTQKDFEICGSYVEAINGDEIRVLVIASPDTIKFWDLHPKKYNGDSFVFRR